MFKTEKRNWGIRTLSDIAQGAFVCIYVGKLFTNEEANEEGQNYGDEYFAELDMIETVEKQKEVRDQRTLHRVHLHLLHRHWASGGYSIVEPPSVGVGK